MAGRGGMSTAVYISTPDKLAADVRCVGGVTGDPSLAVWVPTADVCPGCDDLIPASATPHTRQCAYPYRPHQPTAARLPVNNNSLHLGLLPALTTYHSCMSAPIRRVLRTCLRRTSAGICSMGSGVTSDGVTSPHQQIETITSYYSGLEHVLRLQRRGR